jgi:hypothetical protein
MPFEQNITRTGDHLKEKSDGMDTSSSNNEEGHVNDFLQELARDKGKAPAWDEAHESRPLGEDGRSTPSTSPERSPSVLLDWDSIIDSSEGISSPSGQRSEMAPSPELTTLDWDRFNRRLELAQLAFRQSEGSSLERASRPTETPSPRSEVSRPTETPSAPGEAQSGVTGPDGRRMTERALETLARERRRPERASRSTETPSASESTNPDLARIFTPEESAATREQLERQLPAQQRHAQSEGRRQERASRSTETPSASGEAQSRTSSPLGGRMLQSMGRFLGLSPQTDRERSRGGRRQERASRPTETPSASEPTNPYFARIFTPQEHAEMTRELTAPRRDLPRIMWDSEGRHLNESELQAYAQMMLGYSPQADREGSREGSSTEQQQSSQERVRYTSKLANNIILSYMERVESMPEEDVNRPNDNTYRENMRLIKIFLEAHSSEPGAGDDEARFLRNKYIATWNGKSKDGLKEQERQEAKRLVDDEVSIINKGKGKGIVKE